MIHTDDANHSVRLAGRVPAGDGVRVGIDGVDGAGKSTYADALASALAALGRPVVQVRADDHLAPRDVRYRRGRHSPEGFFLDSYDLPALRAATEAASRSVGRGGAVVVDGLFLHRDELRDLWDLSVWLEVPFAESVARMAARDGTPDDPDHPSLRRYVEGQRHYFAACRPWERAGLVVPNG